MGKLVARRMHQAYMHKILKYKNYRQLIVGQMQMCQRNLGRSKESRSNFRYHVMRQIQYFYVRMIQRPYVRIT